MLLMLGGEEHSGTPPAVNPASVSLVAASSQSLRKTSAIGLSATGFFSCWCNPNGVPGSNIRLVGIGNGGTYMSLRFFNLQASLINPGAGTFPNVASSVNCVAGDKNHLLATWDAIAGMEIYLNGVQTGDLPGPIVISTPADNIAIGEFVDLASGQYFNGLVDETCYGNVLPTAGDIAELYNGGVYKPYENLSAGLDAKLVSYWALDTDGSWVDKKGVNNLTENNNPTTGAPVVT